jgi:hypothetical protein
VDCRIALHPDVRDQKVIGNGPGVAG